MANLIFNICLAAMLFSCGTTDRRGSEDAPSHEIWDELLRDHVNPTGMVDYEGFIRDSVTLNTYLSLLSNHAPDPGSWTREEQLAYWINAYNAFTVKLIIDNYPVESIKDLNPTVAIPTVSTIWNKKFFSIGGVKMSLDEIEHDILRKKFEEPRIHFAINCASISCPPLRPEAFTAAKLEMQLEEQANQFINDPLRNNLDPQHPRLSKIFSWFGGDFTKKGSLLEFINQYAETPVEGDAEIEFMDYNWQLNSQ